MHGRGDVQGQLARTTATDRVSESPREASRGLELGEPPQKDAGRRRVAKGPGARIEGPV